MMIISPEEKLPWTDPHAGSHEREDEHDLKYEKGENYEPNNNSYNNWQLRLNYAILFKYTSDPIYCKVGKYLN